MTLEPVTQDYLLGNASGSTLLDIERWDPQTLAPEFTKANVSPSPSQGIEACIHHKGRPDCSRWGEHHMFALTKQRLSRKV